MHNNKHIILVLLALASMVIAGCSTNKNTSQSRWWHSFNARYNTYYNGAQAYIDGSLEKEQGNKDNFTEMIPLYTVGNKSSRELGKTNFDRAIEKAQKAIARHSIKRRPEWNKSRRKTEKDIEWLNRREYNPFLWKAWMLMGRSQFYKGAFDEAAATFSYMSRLYRTQPAIYGKARAWLAKCYIEEGWTYDAEDVIRNMRRDSLDWRAVKEWDYTYADYYIHTGDFEKAIPYLRKVIKHEMRHKQRAREWYLLGQLEAALGHRENATKAFKRVIRQNPPYQLEFNARIAMTEVMAKGRAKQMIGKLKRMAASDKNKDYLDQVYYAIGNIYLSEKDTMQAITAYERGNQKSTRSGIEKGVLLLHLGDLYWAKEKFSDARRCYGAAIGMLDKDRKDYEQLSNRSKILDELVPYTDAVHLQDSLQALAKMPEAERNAAIDRVIDALKKKEKEERRAQAEQDAQQQQAQNGAIGANNNQTQASSNNQTQNGLWYFYNQMAVNQGKQTFQRQWGKRENVDNWQRVNKTVVGNIGSDANPEDLTDEQRDSIFRAEQIADSLSNIADSAQNDPHKREYYLAQIPFTEEQMQASNQILEDGLHHSGVIFKDRLDNLPLSEKCLRRLTDNYPDYEHMDDVYYHLFLLYNRMGQPDVAESYVTQLKEHYPQSEWTTILTDPYFLENSKFGVHLEDSLYAATYEAFKKDQFAEVAANAHISETRFPLGANRDKFLFIGGLSKLNSGDANACIRDMKEVVEKYPQSRISEMAGMIVNGVNKGKKLRGGKFDLGDVWSRRSAVLNDSDSIKNVSFSKERFTDFKFLLVYNPDSVNENQLLFEMARFNFSNFLVRDFDLEIADLEGLHQMQVSGFRSYDEAYQYARQLVDTKSVVSKLNKNTKTLIISDNNLKLIGTQFSYADYEAFYRKNFVPLRVTKRYLLSEPAEIATPRERDLQEEIQSKAPTQEDLDAQKKSEAVDEGISVPVEIDAPGAQPETEPEGTEISTEIAPAEEPETPKEQPIEDDNTIALPKQTPTTSNEDEDIIELPEEQPSPQPALPENEVVLPENEETVPVTPTEPQQRRYEPEQPVLPEVQQPATTVPKKQPEPSIDEPQAPVEDTGIYFDDDLGTGNTNTNNNTRNDSPVTDDVEDEYYDLDGF